MGCRVQLCGEVQACSGGRHGAPGLRAALPAPFLHPCLCCWLVSLLGSVVLGSHGFESLLSLLLWAAFKKIKLPNEKPSVVNNTEVSQAEAWCPAGALGYGSGCKSKQTRTNKMKRV